MKFNTYWFKPKKYGWGFVPISWEGWAMILLLVSLTVLSGYLNNIFNETASFKDSMAFLFDIGLIILVLMPVHFKKCKGKPTWSWG